mgnify:CR=1 FL=1
MLDAILPLGASATILIVIGLLLLASELSAPAHGVVAGLGIVAITGGAAALLCPGAATMINAPVLLLGGLLSLVAAGLVTTMSLSVRRRGIRPGREALLGVTGRGCVGEAVAAMCWCMASGGAQAALPSRLAALREWSGSTD